MTDRRCGTCKWLEVAPDKKTGRRVVRALWSYPCRFQIVMPPLPDSITTAYDYQPHRAILMEPTEGTTCPTWEALPPKAPKPVQIKLPIKPDAET